MNTPLAWTLVFHLLGMVFWIGGLLMVTQTLSLDSQATDAAAHQANYLSARKTMNALAHPGLLIMIASGALLLYFEPLMLRAGWLHVKLACVVALIVFDIVIFSKVRKLPMRPASRGQSAMFHGVISALFFAILILALIKPF
jgi:putative membrane protein